MRGALIAAALLVADAASAGFSVYYQLHSYNDLREWPAMLRKGARSVKIDPQWAPALVCSLQPRANGSDPRGCLLLNHDTLLPVGNAYFTLDDAFAFITNETWRPYMTRADPFRVALCFKGCGSTQTCPCDGAPDSSFWLSLVDDTFAQMQAAIASLGLNVRLVLDGSAAPTQACMYDRWRPLVSTYITGDDPDGAFLSNDSSRGYDRFQLLNEDTSSWPSAVSRAYGKFVNSSLEFQVWEPSDQPTLLNATDAFIAAGIPHAAGLHMATNTDVAQFEVYAAKATGRAWNGLMPLPAVADVEALAAAVVPRSAAALLWSVLLINGSVPALSVHTFTAVGAPLVLQQLLPMSDLAPARVWTASVAVNASASDAPSGRIVLVVGSSVDALQIVQVNVFTAANGSVSLETECVYPLSLPSNTSAVAVSSWEFAEDRAWLAVGADTQISGQQCRVGLLALSSCHAPTTSPVCIGTLTQGTAAPLSGLALDVVQDPAVGSVAAVVASSNGVVYGLVASTNATAPTPTDPDTLLYTHVGAQPRVTLTSAAADGTQILEMHGDGYCPNNEPQNKNAWTKLCDQTPRVTGGAYLNYNVGSLSAWRSQLGTAAGATPCSADPLHGMFGMGANPVPVLLPASLSPCTSSTSAVDPGAASSPAPSPSCVCALALTQPFTGEGGDPNDCGIAVALPAPGVAVQGWCFGAGGGG